MLDFSAINEKSKGYSRFFREGCCEHVLDGVSDEVFAVLNKEDGGVSIFVEDKVKLELRSGIMKHIRSNKGGFGGILCWCF